MPESYQLPEFISISEVEIQGLVTTAKQVVLNQSQFEKSLATMKEQQQNYQTQLAERKKQLGEQFKVVEDYVANTFLSSLHNTVLNTLLGDENAMNDALKHRDQLLIIHKCLASTTNARFYLIRMKAKPSCSKWRTNIAKTLLSKTENSILILITKWLRR